MEANEKLVGICATSAGSDAESTNDLMSQSHAHINRIKKENLRSTKSFELHHTRSFSEIRHLHPSSTDVSFGITYPKPRNIEALQNNVKRPESVLEMSDLSVQEGEDEMEEDITQAQEKGDKTMKLFLEANISVPLDGAMTSSSSSSSSSLESLDSDFASEHELIVGTWKNDTRDSIALSGSSLEKRFLTPSGQLLYREQQVDAMLDTKRLKLSPSSSVERPMSPLAVRSTDEGIITCASQGDCNNNKNPKEIYVNRNKQDLSYSVHDEEYLNCIVQSDNETEIPKGKKCNCEHYNNLQDLQQLVNEYEDQYRKLVKRRDEQFEEIKVLRKGNMNMHKEHNRLQLIIKECYKQEEMDKEKLTKRVGEKDKTIEELNVNLKHLDDKIKKKEEQITVMRKTIENQELEILKYDEHFKEISRESKALIQALAKELGEENGEAMDSHVEDDVGIVSVLKKRRCSLQDDFKSFSKHVLTPVWTEGKEMELCSQTTDLSIKKLQNQLQDNFHQITSEYKETLSHVQQTEKDIENIQHRTIELETTLLGSPENEKSKSKKDVDLERQFQELKHNETMKENSIIKEDLSKWMNECHRITAEHSKLKVQYEDRIKELYEEKEEANLKLLDLKTDLKKRLEISYGEKTVLEKQLENLKEKYLNNGSKACRKNQEIHSQDIHGLTKKDDIAQVTENTREQKEITNELLTSWGKDKKQLIEKTKALKNQLSEQGKLIGCLVDEGQNLQKETRHANEDLETENSTSWFPERNMEVLPSNMKKTHLEKEEQNSQKILSMFGGDKVLWEIKEIYQDHFDNIYHAITNQELENQSLKEQLVLQEQDKEIHKFYIASLMKTNETSQEDLQVLKTKNQELKKELRKLKDRLLIIDAEQRMSRYFNPKK